MATNADAREPPKERSTNNGARAPAVDRPPDPAPVEKDDSDVEGDELKNAKRRSRRRAAVAAAAPPRLLLPDGAAVV